MQALVLLLLAPCHAGCAKNEPAPDPQPDPDPEEPAITLQADEITKNGVLLTATPSSSTLRYILAVDFAEGFDARTIAATNRALFAEAAAAQGVSLDAYLEANSLTGTQWMRPGPLQPRTPFVAYAYGIDNLGYAVTEVATCPFTTLAVEPGERVDGAIEIIAVNLTDTSVDLTFAPTNESIRYYYTFTDRAGYEAMSADWNTYLYNYMAERVTENLSLEEVVQVLCTTGRRSTRASELRPATTYYACAVGMDRHALLITEVAVKEVTTLEEYERTFGFTATAEEIVWNGAQVCITPADPTAFFYWNVMTAADYDAMQGDEARIETYFEQQLDARRRAELGAYADYYPLTDYILDQCSDKAEHYTFTSLSSATTYYVYAFWVDPKSAKKSSPTWFSEPFATPARTVSAAAVHTDVWLTAGDDWAALDAAGYGHFAGKAILGARLTPAQDAAHWYSNIFAAADLERFSDETFITTLLRSGVADKTAYTRSYGVEWGGDYVILSVAVDQAGNAGELDKAVFTADPAAAEPLDEIPAQ